MTLIRRHGVLFGSTGALAVVATILTGLFLTLATAEATSEKEAPLECLRCHTRALRAHDQLGSGSEACWACHDGRAMKMLRLPDGTQLPISNSNQLCGECHPDPYKAWNKGKHGVAALGKLKLNALRGMKPKCVGCHSAHQPKITLSNGNALLSAPSSGTRGPLDCLSCHVRALEGHDKLGSGSKSCWACHYNMEMGVLHLAGGEDRLKLSDYPQLCAQCHQARYQDWIAGTHGIPAWEVGTVDVHGAERVGCKGCHDPHQPRVSYANITLPHPPRQTPAAPPSLSLLALLGATVLLGIVSGIAILKKGEWP